MCRVYDFDHLARYIEQVIRQEQKLGIHSFSDMTTQYRLIEIYRRKDKTRPRRDHEEPEGSIDIVLLLLLPWRYKKVVG
jgi:hypothetical protein